MPCCFCCFLITPTPVAPPSFQEPKQPTVLASFTHFCNMKKIEAVAAVKTMSNRLANRQAAEAEAAEKKANQPDTNQGPAISAVIDIDATGDNTNDSTSIGTGDHLPERRSTDSVSSGNPHDNTSVDTSPSSDNWWARPLSFFARLVTFKLASKRHSADGSSESSAAPAQEENVETTTDRRDSTSSTTTSSSGSSSKRSRSRFLKNLAAGKRKLAKRASASRRKMHSWGSGLQRNVSTGFGTALDATRASLKETEEKVAAARAKTSSWFDKVAASSKGFVLSTAQDVVQGLDTSLKTTEAKLAAACASTGTFFDLAGSKAKRVVVRSAKGTRKGVKRVYTSVKGDISAACASTEAFFDNTAAKAKDVILESVDDVRHSFKKVGKTFKSGWTAFSKALRPKATA